MKFANQLCGLAILTAVITLVLLGYREWTQAACFLRGDAAASAMTTSVSSSHSGRPSQWPSLQSLDTYSRAKIAAVTLPWIDASLVGHSAVRQLVAAAGLSPTTLLLPRHAGLQGGGHSPKPPSTHNPASDTHYENTDTHFADSTDHYGESDTHYENTNTHYVETNLHYDNTDLHSVSSDTHFQSSAVHTFVTDTHYLTTDTHNQNSTTHSMNSDKHYSTSGNHQVGSDSHGPISGQHYAWSVDHNILSNTHDGISSTHAAGSLNHDLVSCSGCVEWYCNGTAPPVIIVPIVLPGMTVNGTDPKSGRVLVQAPAGTSSFPLPYQSEVGKIHFTVEYVVDIPFMNCDDPPPAQPPPPVSDAPIGDCPPWFDAPATLNVRIKDPEDPSVYAHDPSDDDNLDEDRMRGNIVVSAPYFEHAKGIPELDASGNKVKAHIMPQFVGLTPSSFQWNQTNGIQAYIYRVEFDIELTTQYQGDNYVVEFSLNTAYSDADAECFWLAPEFRDEYPAGYVDPWATLSYEIMDFAGPYAAWDRVLLPFVTSPRVGAQLQTDAIATSTSIRVWEPSWIANAYAFAVGDQVRIVDAANPSGQELTVTMVSDVSWFNNGYGHLVEYEVTPPLGNTYKAGFPGDSTNDVPDGRGACLVKSSGQSGPVECWEIETQYIEEACEELFIEPEFQPTSGVTVLPGFLWVAPHEGNFTLWSTEAKTDALQAQLKLWMPAWGVPASNPASTGVVIAGGLLQTVGPNGPGYESGWTTTIPEYWRTSVTSYGYWDYLSQWQPCTVDVQLARAEVTAHEMLHLADTPDCGHSSNVFGTAPCLMNNSVSGCYNTCWSDGEAKVGHDYGSAPVFDPGDCYIVRRKPKW